MSLGDPSNLESTALKHLLLLKGLTYMPRVLITDKLKSYGAATRAILPSVQHRQHRYLNNRAENSPQPTGQRERRMQRFQDLRLAFIYVGKIRDKLRNIRG